MVCDSEAIHAIINNCLLNISIELSISIGNQKGLTEAKLCNSGSIKSIRQPYIFRNVNYLFVNPTYVRKVVNNFRDMLSAGRHGEIRTSRGG